jgi:hypothetical protein
MRGASWPVFFVLALLFGSRRGKGGKVNPAPALPGSLGLTVYPVSGGAKIISGYGPRGASFHYGVDLGAPMGRAVLACVNGAVRFGTDVKGGNVAIVTAADGVAFYYAHLSGFEGSARAVQAGDVIGFVGMTGNAKTTVPHVHFEIWPLGTYTPTPPDPTPFLQTAKTLPAQTDSAGVIATTDPGSAATSAAAPTQASHVIPVKSSRDVAASTHGPSAPSPATSTPSTASLGLQAQVLAQQATVNQLLHAYVEAEDAYSEEATKEIDAAQQQQMNALLADATSPGTSINLADLGSQAQSAGASPVLTALLVKTVQAQQAYEAAVAALHALQAQFQQVIPVAAVVPA